MTEPRKPKWDFDEFAKILDASVPMRMLGFGPILPRDVDASDFFDALEFYGPTHADKNDRLKFEIEKRKQLTEALKKPTQSLD